VATKKATTAKRLDAVEETLHVHGVMLQQIQSQLQFVAEAVTGLSQKLDTKIDELEARLTARITLLEEVVRQNSRDIRKNSEDIRKNSEDIRVAREEIAQLRRDFERRSELARVEALEQRLARVEAKLGLAS
jgi:hypothetical protein